LTAEDTGFSLTGPHYFNKSKVKAIMAAEGSGGSIQQWIFCLLLTLTFFIQIA